MAHLRFKLGICAVFLWAVFFSSSTSFFYFWRPAVVVQDATCSCTPSPALAVNYTVFEPQLPLGKHTFRPDGLLEVNANGNHPIFELIALAEKEWKGKLRMASTSFDELVAEYRRRYHRNPPKGFDDWWRYARKHDVQLPDEYDQIYHDLEPFWGLEPQDLIDIQGELEDKKDSFTIGKSYADGVGVVHYAFEEGKYDQLILGANRAVDLLKDVEQFLPSFRATFSPHDGPNRLSDFEVKTTALAAAQDRVYLSRDSFPKVNPTGWVSACSPSSPARLRKMNLDQPAPAKPKKTFIYNHRRSMDPCLHPELFWSHGQFLSHNYGPTPQRTMAPEFASCSTTIHHNIHIPTPYGWIEDIFPRSNDPEFDDKQDERLLWRGSNTGIFHRDTTRWQGSHRISAVRMANELNGTIDVLVPPDTDGKRVGPPKTMRNSRINPALMDVAFAGKAHQCAPEKYCEYLEELFPFRERQSLKQAGNYKYVLDVDGNGWSGRFKRLITSNSLIFKATIYPEWFTDRVAPWVHYVPVQVDLSDLHDALVFFRGDANGEGAHEDLARKIAMEGRNWSKTFWRREDIVAYFFRLMLEYARLMSLDREAMTYKGDGYGVI